MKLAVGLLLFALISVIVISVPAYAQTVNNKPVCTPESNYCTPDLDKIMHCTSAGLEEIITDCHIQNKECYFTGTSYACREKTECRSNADCDDNNPNTIDQCVNGACTNGKQFNNQFVFLVPTIILIVIIVVVIAVTWKLTRNKGKSKK
jgi:hypothetical protein